MKISCARKPVCFLNGETLRVHVTAVWKVQSILGSRKVINIAAERLRRKVISVLSQCSRSEKFIVL